MGKVATQHERNERKSAFAQKNLSLFVFFFHSFGDSFGFCWEKKRKMSTNETNSSNDESSPSTTTSEKKPSPLTDDEQMLYWRLCKWFDATMHKMTIEELRVKARGVTAGYRLTEEQRERVVQEWWKDYARFC
jgi:hypothetical protein